MLAAIVRRYPAKQLFAAVVECELFTKFWQPVFRNSPPPARKIKNGCRRWVYGTTARFSRRMLWQHRRTSRALAGVFAVAPQFIKPADNGRVTLDEDAVQAGCGNTWRSRQQRKLLDAAWEELHDRQAAWCFAREHGLHSAKVRPSIAESPQLMAILRRATAYKLHRGLLAQCHGRMATAMLYAKLRDLRRFFKGVFYRTDKQLADDTGLSCTPWRRAREDLIKSKLIRVTRKANARYRQG